MFIKKLNSRKLVVTAIIVSTMLALGMLFQSSDPTGKNWQIKIRSENEPGEKLVVTGKVFESDGKTPVEDVEILVYHTDANGYYGEGDDRLDGIMFTNSEGRYEYHTIKPAPYPGGTNPAHVHYRLRGKNIPEQWFELQFADDPHLKKEQIEKEMKKKNFSQIQKLTKDSDGSLKCEMDIMIER
ncbi:MAG: hypothetical protein IPM56_16555 [Ignavibacteriales bacterium]|nr:MAG: hypothetical protein IPM56_16555 [Ignavibacteriales bacterium]